MEKDPVLEDLKDFVEDEIEEVETTTKKWLKRLPIIFMTLFLILIVIIYLLPGNFLTLLEGKIDSYKLSEDLTITLRTGEKIVFDSEVYDKLKQLYFDNQKTEIKVCLLGTKTGLTYQVISLSIPETFSKTLFSVSAEPCSSDTIIALHTHPYPRCLASNQDIRSHKAWKQINPDALSALMCEPDRFAFYGT